MAVIVAKRIAEIGGIEYPHIHVSVHATGDWLLAEDRELEAAVNLHMTCYNFWWRPGR